MTGRFSSQGRYLLLTFAAQCSTESRFVERGFVLVQDRFLVSGIRWIYAFYTPMHPWWSNNDAPVGKEKLYIYACFSIYNSVASLVIYYY